MMKQIYFSKERPSCRGRMRMLVLALLAAVACLPVWAQQRTVEGAVTGEEADGTAVPLVGVAIVVKDAPAYHAVTDVNGKFKIRIRGSEDVLVFQYLGYRPQEVAVGSKTRVDVEMLQDQMAVETVVVTALGITRKEKSLGYAVSKVTDEDLNNTVTGNWLSGLAGKVAGLNFDQSSAGPGGSIRVTLRGEGSLSYDNNTALFVVDGVPIGSDMTSNTDNGSYGNTVATIDYGNGAADINPDDVESVSVLKGPAATALYGSRAANGAIIITTKSGRKTRGLNVTYSMGVTFEKAGFFPDFQNQYGSGVYESAQINGVTTPPEYSYWNVPADKSDTGEKITRFHARSSFGERYDAAKMRYLYASRNWETDEYKRLPWVAQDWYKGFFQTGVTYTNSISLSGSTGDGNSIRFSVKDMRNEWIVPNTGYNSQNFNLSVSQKINRIMRLNGKVTYYRKNSDNLPSAGYSTSSPLYALIWNPSSSSVDDLYTEWKTGRIREMNAAGTTGSGYLINPGSDNPYMMVNEQLNTQSRNRVYGSMSLDIDLYKEKLKLTLRSGMDLNNDFRTQRKPQYSLGHTNGWYREQTVHNFEMNNDFLLSYKDRFGDFDISASFGGNNMYREARNVTETAENLAEPNVFRLVNVAGVLSVSNFRSKKSVNSFYGFLNLSWRDMLFLDVTGRNDWSSTLAPGNNSYFYPSVSVSVLLDEVFKLHDKAPWIDLLKVRGSWANVGNDTQPYQLLPVYNNSDFQGGFRLSNTIQNYNIKPENIESWEVGVEARFFRNRIGLDVAYYDSATTNQIISVPSDWATGAPARLINAGKVTNKGVEVGLNLRPVQTRDWRWDISFNWSKNWNKLVELAPGVEVWQLNSKLTVGSTVFTYAYPGRELGRLYGIGFKRAPEGAFYVNEDGMAIDCSGQKIIDPKTGNPELTEELLDLGSIYPKYKAGMTHKLSWRNLSMTATFVAQVGGNAYSVTSAVLSTLGKLNNTVPGRYDGLIAEGVNLNADGSYTQNRTVTTNVTEYYNLYEQVRTNIEQHTYSTSYLKLKEMRIDYNLPAKVCRKLKFIQGVGIGFYATNLFCLTDWPQYDPEVASWSGASLTKGVETGGYPMTRTYGFNLKLTF